MDLGFFIMDFGINDSLAIQMRSWPILHELIEADSIVSPTDWQRQQFPMPWRDQIKVILRMLQINVLLKTALSPQRYAQEKYIQWIKPV